uniref:TlpA family protein disulfide reductase n=1 Tax=Cellvibrio fontiphilus TaxID=1815559 RepID=UPI002B4BB1AD|nr:TlpA disulfide reductase family protein [Cellvibrio fontiphilus]
MEAVQLFGASIPLVPLLLLVAGVLVALLGKLLRAPFDVSDDFLKLVLVSLVAGRVVFVFLHLDAYRDNAWAVLDIRDRGVDIYAALITAVVYLAWLIYRRAAQRKWLLQILLPVALLTGGSYVLLKSYLRPPSLWPDLTFVTLANETRSSQSVRLQTDVQREFTLVNLWATWCPPCHREMPVLAAAQHEFPQGRFILLNQGESAEVVRDYLVKNNLQFEQVWLDTQSQFSQFSGNRGLPLTLIYDKQGKLVDGHVGQLSRATLMEKLSGFKPKKYTDD